ncbi:hypothetical protein F2Q68_00040435 [Brassica cretica]|uniref:Uncharacterized protein n=1 Tax=Brassica cretica TaxID=69181 RepID=A0A8S9MFB2_BRACR|nr:hypothetical protein F2Q68_00040435 [Brassica cretica]
MSASVARVGDFYLGGVSMATELSLGGDEALSLSGRFDVSVATELSSTATELSSTATELSSVETKLSIGEGYNMKEPQSRGVHLVFAIQVEYGRVINGSDG